MEVEPTVALSTCEAEYMAVAKTTQESLYLVQLLNGMDSKHRYEPVKILGDNQGAIALSKDPVNRQKCKHRYQISFHQRCVAQEENRDHLLSNHKYDC